MEKVGRYDNFFDLGGHSLLIVSMVERLRKSGLQAGIRMVFDALNLAELASNVRPEDEERWDVPRSLIPEGCRRVSPEMLPLVKLKQEEIDGVVAKVPEGAVNVQDIYPLSPLQQGVLFYHRLHEKNDPYVTAFILRFDSEKLLEDFASAINVVVSRHDAFRTAVSGRVCHVLFKWSADMQIFLSNHWILRQSRKKRRRWSASKSIWMTLLSLWILAGRRC